MARGRQYKIGSECFRSKKQLVDRAQQLIRSHAAGAVINDPETEHFLRHLFARHPNYAEKMRGREICHFGIDKRDYGTKCFYAVFKDGSWDHFSYVKCL